MAKAPQQPKAVNRRFDVQNKAQGLAEVYLYDVIGEGPEGGISAKGFIDAIKTAAPDATSLVVNINSPGGSVFEAVAIYNFLRSIPKAHITVNIDGLAASAAATIAMAGDERNIAESAMMMVHPCKNLTFGGAEDLRKTADVLDKLDATTASIYAKATSQPMETVTQWMADETWFSSDEAMAAGLATAITQGRKAVALAGLPAEAINRLAYKHPEKLAPLMVSDTTLNVAPADGAEKGITMSKKEAPAPVNEAEKPVSEAPAVEPKGDEKPAPVNTAAAAGTCAKCNAAVPEGSHCCPNCGACPVCGVKYYNRTGTDFLNSFGDAGGVWFAQGKSFDEARELHTKAIAAQNKALTDEVASLKTRLDAANKALGVDPLSADVSDKPAASEADEKKYQNLLKAFNGNEARAKRAFENWKKKQKKA